MRGKGTVALRGVSTQLSVETADLQAVILCKRAHVHRDTCACTTALACAHMPAYMRAHLEAGPHGHMQAQISSLTHIFPAGRGFLGLH